MGNADPLQREHTRTAGERQARQSWPSPAVQRTAERDLQLNEENYRASFTSCDPSFCIIELVFGPEGEATDFRFIEANRAHERGTGLRALPGTFGSEVTPGAEREWLEIFTQVARTGTPLSVEQYHQATHRWYLAHVSRVGADSHQIALLFEDISQRRNEERRHSLLLALSDGLRPLHEPGEIQTEASRILRDHLQADVIAFGERADDDAVVVTAEASAPGRSSVLGVQVRLDHLSSADREKLEKVCVVAQESCERSRTELQQALDMDAYAVIPLPGRAKRPAGFVIAGFSGIHRWAAEELRWLEEAGERTWAAVESGRSEQALRESEDRFRTLSDTAPMGVAVSSPEGRFLYCSRAFEMMLGYEKDELLGQPATVVYTGADERSEWLAEMERTGILKDRTVRFRRKDGSVLWVAINVTPMLFGGKQALVGVAQDVTARHAAEEDLREREEEQAFLLHLSDQLRPVADPIRIQEIAAELVGEHLHANQVHYGETQGDYVVIERGWGKGRSPMVGRFHWIDFGERLVAGYRAGRTMVSHDTSQDPEVTAAEGVVLAEAGIGAYVAAPLLKDGGWVATFAVHSVTARRWTEREVHLVREVAERTWAAVEQARAEAALRRSRAELAQELEDTKRMQRISGLLIKDDGDRLYSEIVDTAMAVMRADFGSIQVMTEEPEELRLLAWRNFHPDSAQYWERVSATAATTCGSALQHGERVIVADVREAPFLRGTEGLRFLLLSGIAAVVSTPLTTREGQVIGMISTHWRDPHVPGERELGLLDILARQAADFLERQRGQQALRESGERMRRAISVPKVGVNFFRLNGRIDEANEAFQRMCGYTVEELRACEHRDQLTAPEFLDVTKRRAQDLAERGQTLPYEKEMIRKDGTRWWGLFAPTRLSGAGPDSECVEFVIDITGAKRAEQALEDSERRFRLLVDNVQEYALFQTDLEGDVTSWNPGAERLFGYGSIEILGTSAERLFTAADQQAGVLREEIARVRNGEHAVASRWVERKDGSQFWAQWVTEPVRDDAGELRGLVKVLRDETDRKRAEDRRRLLVGELNHRVKNTLAIVQAIANQTLRTTPQPEEFVARFGERLQALSNAHNLLTSTSWEGADLADIVRQQLMLEGNGAQISAEGPAAFLDARASLALALVLHEMGTNARKHGALSVPDGRLTIGWRVVDEEGERRLRLDWAEQNGPVVRSPVKSGFGTTLVNQSLRGVGGRTELIFEAAGVRCRIELPLVGRKDHSQC